MTSNAINDLSAYKLSNYVICTVMQTKLTFSLHIFVEVHFLFKPLLSPLGTIVWSRFIQKFSRFSNIFRIISGLLP